MNWYSFIKMQKVAALWDTDSDGTFSDELRRLYELEYKYSMIRLKPFQGMPQRQQAIMDRIADRAREAITEIVGVLEPVFEKWLQGHALTNADDWSNAQLGFARDEFGPNDFDNWWDTFLAGVQNYTQMQVGYFGQQKMDCSELAQMLRGLGNQGFEMFMREWISERQTMVQEDLWSEWNNGYSDYETEEQVEQAVEQQQAEYEQYTFGEYIHNFAGEDCQSLREALETVSYYTGIEPLFTMLYSKFLFPKWFEHWQPQGIEDTRERVENAYKMIQNIEAIADSDITKALANINIIIMTSHQTGGMTDYISEEFGAEDVKDVMDEMTNLGPEDYGPWNEELRAAGVQI